MRNYYPDELRTIADMCDKFNEVDSNAEVSISFKNGVTVIDCNEPNRPLGELVDEIGGSWSFKPAS